MMMGDNVKSAGKPVKFSAKITGANIVPDGEYTVQVIKNGNPFSTIKTTGKMPVVEFTDTPVTVGRTYYRIVVEGPPTDYPQVPGSMKRSGNMVGCQTRYASISSPAFNRYAFIF